MPIEKLITYHLPEGMHIISEKDVLGLIRKVKYEIATYEDSRFMMKTPEEVFKMIMRRYYKSSEDFSNDDDKVPYEVDFSIAKKAIESYKKDLTWKGIVENIEKS